LGNVDESLYGEIPDWKIPLTRRGEKQSLKAATDLYALTKNEFIFCYCSPYTRAKETWKIMSQHIAEQGDVTLIGTREEPRIAEQQFGNFQSESMRMSICVCQCPCPCVDPYSTGDGVVFWEYVIHSFVVSFIQLYPPSPCLDPRKVRTAKIERRTFGRFFYRFPNGEAGLDVYNRVSSFLATMSRDLLQFQDSGADMSKLNIVIVTHGLTLRLFLMRYFQLSVEEFEESHNAQNAKLVVLDRIDPTHHEETPTTNIHDGGGGNSGSDEPATSSSLVNMNLGKRKSFFRLQDEARDALNLKGDVSSERPVFFRGDAMDQVPFDLDEEI
jgi:broad specificity phosphatase PhoE